MTLERGVILHGRYRIMEILGQGGMGSVYRAVDENLGVDVAVKENLFTTDEYARQFRLEAIILANLRQPNLTRVTDHFVLEGQGQYLVMDYIEGEDLRQRMERTNSLPDDEVILIGAAMSKALHYLHSRKPPILHRDVKPGNVKISPTGEIFLVDFGLAKVIQGSQVTTTGARAMTPGYSPPEQYGTARTDPRTDIYSLGATLYAALTGVIPEDGLARAMENVELTPVRKRSPKVSRRLANAVEKAMEVDAEDRFQSADDFRKALLASNSKTQRLVQDDFNITPSPSVPLVSTEKTVEQNPDDNPENDPSMVGVPLTPLPIADTPRKKRLKERRKERWKFIRFLLLLIFGVGSIATTALYYPQLSATLSELGIISVPTATATPTVIPLIETATEALPLLAETEAVTATKTVEPTATNTPEPTLTPTPTNTPTPIPTPLGGGAGQIAFVSDRAGIPQIYLANSAGNGIQPITNLSDGACQPDWSPDGEKIVFVSPCQVDQDVFTGSSLFVVHADGTNLFQLTTAPGGDFEPAWSPDGNLIAFTSLRDDDHMQIYSINLEENIVQRLTETDQDEFARQPAWSPFGNQIAYSIRRYSAYQIWVMTDTGQSPEQITRSGYTYWDILPIWSPDGMAILYNQHASGNTTRMWLMSINYENRGGEGVDVDAAPLPVSDVDYSNDGFWLAFEGKDGDNRDIYLMTVTGASRTQLTTDPGNDFDPAWRPLP